MPPMPPVAVPQMVHSAAVMAVACRVVVHSAAVMAVVCRVVAAAVAAVVLLPATRGAAMPCRTFGAVPSWDFP